MITRCMVKSNYVQKTISSSKLIDFRKGKEKFGNSGIISTPLTVVHSKASYSQILRTLVDIYQGIGIFSVLRFGLYSPNHQEYENKRYTIEKP